MSSSSGENLLLLWTLTSNSCDLMLVSKISNFYRCLHTSSLGTDSEAYCVIKRINSFLSNNFVQQRTLLPCHSYIITTGHTQNKFISAKLIASYTLLNQPLSSTKIFASLNWKDLFLWNSIIKAHFSTGSYGQAIDFFIKMRFFGYMPNEFTLPMVISACAELGSLFLGMGIHCLITKVNLFDENTAIGASLVYMYSKCGTLENASLVFDEIPNRDVVAWTALVIGYVQNGESEKGLQCIGEMHRVGGDGERVNFRTLEGGFQACGNSSMLAEGRCLHGLSLRSGIVSSHSVRSAILSMYSKCGSVEEAVVSFGEVVNKDLFSWTSIIGVYARMGLTYDCLQMISRMLVHGLYPDGTLISCLISGFSNSMNVFEGKAFHGFIVRRNYCVDQLVCSSLLSMYSKFGLMASAEKFFSASQCQEKDSWNLMIVGYEKAGLVINCLSLFRDQQHRGFESNSNSLTSVISSCSKLEAIQSARSVHCHVLRNFLFEKVSIVNSLITMYGKFGYLILARRLFRVTAPDITSWNSLISSYVDNGDCSKAVALFDEMISVGLKPNTATLVTLLSTCARLGSVEKGRQIHNYIKREELCLEVAVATALVDMYAKCGEIETAKQIFYSMNEKDVVSWNVMISCYGMHGHGESAIQIFQQMEENEAGVTPNRLTFLAVLSACVHAGLLDEAKSLFNKMETYSVTPSMKHYACMVDLYGRCGFLQEAEALISSMPFTPDGGMWGSLLSACKLHNNVDMGVKIAKRAIAADPDNDGYYILVSDFYSSMELWGEVEQMRQVMKDRGVRKTLGWSAV